MPFQNMLLTIWMKQHVLLCTGSTFSQRFLPTFKTNSKVNDFVETREASL